MTITLHAQHHDTEHLGPDDRSTAADDGVFADEDIQEFLRAMAAWQVPACTLVCDISCGKAGGDKQNRTVMYLLDVNATSRPARVYTGTSGDQLHLLQRDAAPESGLSLGSSYPLASCSKPITAYALHLALQQAGLSWDTPVKYVIPDFRLQRHADANPDVDTAAMCTFEDLVSHRSGLGGWHVVHGPHLADRSIVDVLANLPTVKPLRESYNYASLPLHVAAHAIEILDSLSKAKQVGKEHARPTVLTLDDHAKGRSFQDFVKDEIFDPLTMGAAYRQVDLKAPMQGHYQFSGLHGPGVAVGVPNGLEKAMSFASGGVWMNARDMAKWLRAAPMLPGFSAMADERIKDPNEGWLEWRDDGMSGGLCLRSFRHRGVEIVNMAGTVPDFASLTVWFPKAKGNIAFGMMCNAGVGGVYLRALMRCRAAERVGNLPRKDWFNIIDKTYKQDLTPAPWMSPLPGPPFGHNEQELLCRTWRHPSFPDLTITSSDLVMQLPELEIIPYLPFMYGFTRCIFSRDHEAGDEINVDEGIKLKGCFEVVVDGVAHRGLPFTAEIMVGGGENRMLIDGWADEQEGAPLLVFKAYCHEK